MRHLPKNKTQNQDIIIGACYDYYGTNLNAEDKKSARKTALWIMGRRRNIKLTEGEQKNMLAIKENLKDKTYTESFILNSILDP